MNQTKKLLWDKVRKALFMWMDLGKLSAQRTRELLNFVKNDLENPEEKKTCDRLQEWQAQFQEFKALQSLFDSESAENLEKIALELSELNEGEDIEKIVQGFEAIDKGAAEQTLLNMNQTNPELGAFFEALIKNKELFTLKSMKDIKVITKPGLFDEGSLRFSI